MTTTPEQDVRRSSAAKGNGGARGVRVTASERSTQGDPREEIPVLGFRDYWYPVISARKVPRRKPVGVKLLGDDLCVFRGTTGIAVISNWCPHRGASLAGGDCHFAGTVSCPYHGWTFDETGTVKAVLSEGPGDLSTIAGRVQVRTYPSVVLHGVVFAWMGAGEPTDPARDLPPELFDGSMIQHDATLWKANWRQALENLSDNHTNYVHRNAVQVLMQPFMKVSYRGARPIIDGGGVGLSFYSDGKEKDRPYREYFPEIDGYWPKHRYRLLWTRFFALRPLRWLWQLGSGGYPRPAQDYHPGSHEWNHGPHMPGMQRINGGTAMYTRWCVPIDERTTREFYFWATRPERRVERFWERAKYPVAQKLLRNRNLGFQDGDILQEQRFDLPERFSPYDVETVGWRRLAILSSRYGGRHDRIPPEVVEEHNADPKERHRQLAEARRRPAEGS